MSNLSQLPNIGKTLEDKLSQIGVNTIEQLDGIGSREVFLKIRAIDNTACFNMLCAIEGAIQRKRWHYLSDEDKDNLKKFYNSLK